MSLQSLILDRSLPSFRSSPVVCAVATASGPGRWALVNLVLALVCVLAGVIILSVKLVGAEPCFQSLSGNCGQARQVRAGPTGEAVAPTPDAMPSAIPDPLRRSDALLAL